MFGIYATPTSVLSILRVDLISVYTIQKLVSVCSVLNVGYTCVRVYSIYVYTACCIDIYTHARTYIAIFIHTRTHTHTHTHTQDA